MRRPGEPHKSEFTPDEKTLISPDEVERAIQRPDELAGIPEDHPAHDLKREFEEQIWRAKEQRTSPIASHRAEAPAQEALFGHHVSDLISFNILYTGLEGSVGAEAARQSAGATLVLNLRASEAAYASARIEKIKARMMPAYNTDQT